MTGAKPRIPQHKTQANATTDVPLVIALALQSNPKGRYVVPLEPRPREQELERPFVPHRREK